MQTGHGTRFSHQLQWLPAACLTLVVSACGGDTGATSTATLTTVPENTTTNSKPTSSIAMPSNRPPVEVAPAQGAYPLLAQPEEVPFPTESWPVGEWPGDLDRASIEAAVETGFADGGNQRVRAVIIVQNGRIVFEDYSPNPNDGADVVMPSFSLSKSLASAAIGIMVNDGLLDVMDTSLLAEWSVVSDIRSKIRLDDLLRMSSGLEWREQEQSGIDLIGLLTAPDSAGYAIAKPLAAPPGTVFNYSTGTTSILARIVDDRLGSTGASLELLDERLFEVIGIDTATTGTDEVGTWLAGFSADMTARDFAKFGLLYLRDGVWDGQRILPEDWVDYTRTPTTEDNNYGAHFRLDPDRPGVLFARGFRGQTIVIDPSHDLVVVTLATDRAISQHVTEAILGVFDK